MIKLCKRCIWSNHLIRGTRFYLPKGPRATKDYAKRMRRAGKTIGAIARKLGLSERRVVLWLRSR